MSSVESGSDATRERERLVRAVQAATGVGDARILGALRAVPREAFVPDDLAVQSYADRALPIGQGQTVSQPSMLALMLSALAPLPADRALEIGAGSGYAAALLGRLARSVLGFELLPDLAARARGALERTGATNVRIENGDGVRAARGRGPFDVILVSAAAEAVPDALLAELAPGGRIAIPVGDSYGQRLLVGRRDEAGETRIERRTACMFVPLVTPA